MSWWNIIQAKEKECKDEEDNDDMQDYKIMRKLKMKLKGLTEENNDGMSKNNRINETECNIKRKTKEKQRRESWYGKLWDSEVYTNRERETKLKDSTRKKQQ